MRSPVFLTGFSFLAMECLVTSWSNQYNSWECQARVLLPLLTWNWRYKGTWKKVTKEARKENLKAKMKKQGNNKNMPENDVAMSADDAPPNKKIQKNPWHVALGNEVIIHIADSESKGAEEDLHRALQELESLYRGAGGSPRSFCETGWLIGHMPENLPPQSLTWNLKISPWKRRSLLEPSFSVSMLNLGGANYAERFPLFFLKWYFCFQSKVLPEKWWDVSIGQKITVDWQIII